jgi:menaquinone-dependent protoporphyrinogen oxidase
MIIIKPKLENEMHKKILVTYASKYGATAGIAEKIAQVLDTAGLSVDLIPVKEMRDISPYGAVILGSAVYIGGWMKPAAKFLKSNQQALSKIPVWIFSSGPTGEGDAVELLEGWSFPENLKPIAERIQPREMVIFHGAIEKDKLPAIYKWMLKNVKAGMGDFRDWQAITSWAESIAAQLQNEQ